MVMKLQYAECFFFFLFFFFLNHIHNLKVMDQNSQNVVWINNIEPFGLPTF